MEFGWINLIGAAIVVLILIPNIVYAVRNRASDEHTHNALMVIIEQIGRYACIVFMWLPLLVWKFSFGSVVEMLLYLGGNAVLVVLYCIFWGFYFRNKKKTFEIALAVLPTCIFLLSGLVLQHWLLVIGAVLFGAGHIYITVKNSSI